MTQIASDKVQFAKPTIHWCHPAFECYHATYSLPSAELGVRCFVGLRATASNFDAYLLEVWRSCAFFAVTEAARSILVRADLIEVSTHKNALGRARGESPLTLHPSHALLRDSIRWLLSL